MTTQPTIRRKRKIPVAIPDVRIPDEVIELDWIIGTCRVLLSKSIKWHFIDLSIIPEIAAEQAKNRPQYVVVKVSEPVNTDHITSPKEPMRHPLCRIHPLYSASLLFAYVIVIPVGKLLVRNNFVSIIRPSAVDTPKFTAIGMIAQDGHLSVFHTEDGACVISFTDQFNNLPADILKGSMA